MPTLAVNAFAKPQIVVLDRNGDKINDTVTASDQIGDGEYKKVTVSISQKSKKNIVLTNDSMIDVYGQVKLLSLSKSQVTIQASASSKA